MALFNDSIETPTVERIELSDVDSVMPQVASSDADNKGDVLDVHAVVLTNYLRTHHVLALREFSKRVRKLTILLSVSMEPDRGWEAKWEGLEVQIQKNFMWTANWKHTAGFSEQNFIHFPIDTPWKLLKLKPDVVLSYEMGARTMLASLYRMFRRKIPLVMVGNMSQHIEDERGFVRRTWRKGLCRLVDHFTYNGASCKRYLESLGIPEEQLFHFPYCIDDATVYRGETKPPENENAETTKLLYCGSISERKGILQFSKSLSQWCGENPNRQVELSIAGSGDLEDQVAQTATGNFKVTFLGNCDTNQLRDAYGSTDICVFPTLADEWGLVPIEAMASGVPVLGSVLAQSVECCCTDSQDSWTYHPGKPNQVTDAIDRALNASQAERKAMGAAAREAVAHISATTSGKLLFNAVSTIMKPLGTGR